MRVVRGRLRRRRERRRRPGDDPDRQLDRRPGGRHPPLPARLRAAHHRRALPADPVRADGRPGRDARHDQDRAQPRARARPVPQGDPRARPDPGDLRRHRRRRPRGRRGARTRPRPRSRRRWPPRSTAWRSSPRTSRTRTTTPPGSSCSPATTSRRRPATARSSRSFIFNVRNLPAALYKALGGFATNGVNMTKLESYMVGGEFTATQFLAEVDGHPEDAGVARALEELAFFTTDVKILGVYPADPFRRRVAARAHSAGFCIRLNMPHPAGRRAPPSGRSRATSNAGASSCAPELARPWPPWRRPSSTLK